MVIVIVIVIVIVTVTVIVIFIVIVIVVVVVSVNVIVIMFCQYPKFSTDFALVIPAGMTQQNTCPPLSIQPLVSQCVN